MGKEVNPFEKKCCADCGHLFSAVNWWCGSKEASEYRGTRIPGVHNCHFWKPKWKYIPKKYKTPENGYVSRSQKIKTFIKKLLTTP